MEMQLLLPDLAALVAGGSVGFVIWWCWVHPRNVASTSQGDCERCGRETDVLVSVRLTNDVTGPSYEMYVCEMCVEDLRGAARMCRHCGQRAVYVGVNKLGADLYRCARGHITLFRHGQTLEAQSAGRRERRAQ